MEGKIKVQGLAKGPDDAIGPSKLASDQHQRLQE